MTGKTPITSMTREELMTAIGVEILEARERGGDSITGSLGADATRDLAAIGRAYRERRARAAAPDFHRIVKALSYEGHFRPIVASTGALRHELKRLIRNR